MSHDVQLVGMWVGGFLCGIGLRGLVVAIWHK
jgi:hypothetical protein